MRILLGESTASPRLTSPRKVGVGDPNFADTNFSLGGTQKGGFAGTRVHSDVPPERKPERGYIRMFPRNENRNEGTFAKTALLRNRPFISQLILWTSRFRLKI